MGYCIKCCVQDGKSLFRCGILRLSTTLLIATLALSSLSKPTQAQLANPTLLHPDDNAQVSEDLLSRRWPNGVVPFELVVTPSSLSPSLEQFRRDRFFRLNRWERLTSGAVRFVEDPIAVPRIRIVLTQTNIDEDQEKNNKLGRNGTGGLRGILENNGDSIALSGAGARSINIRPDVSYSVHHELGHVLGRWHHQKHPESGECLTLEKNATSRLGYGHFIGRYTSDSIMQYGAPQADYDTWVVDPIGCPVMPLTDPPSDFDVRYFQKMYGVNGDYFNNVDWCRGTETYIFVGDFNGDGVDDLLCHTKNGGLNPGSRRIDFGRDRLNSVFGAGDWTEIGNPFCRLSNRDLLVGDLNVDGRDDLLCFDSDNGRRFVDFADGNGRFGGADTEFTPFCIFQTSAGTDYTGQVYVADFDGDGGNDMLCHDGQTGRLEIDFAFNDFGLTDWSFVAEWCKDPDQSIIVGNFSDDNLSDLVCHDRELGTRQIAYAIEDRPFEKVWEQGVDFSFSTADNFCTGDNKIVYAADIDGNGLDDLICHDRKFGSVAIDFALGPAEWRNFSGAPNTIWGRGSDLLYANYYNELSFCNAQDAFLLVGQFPTPDAIARQSLYCNNMETGHQVGRYTFGN